METDNSLSDDTSGVCHSDAIFFGGIDF